MAKACITAHIRSAYTDTRSGFTSSPAHAPGGLGMGGVRGEVGFSGTVGGTAGAASKQASEPTQEHIFIMPMHNVHVHTHTSDILNTTLYMCKSMCSVHRHHHTIQQTYALHQRTTQMQHTRIHRHNRDMYTHSHKIHIRLYHTHTPTHTYIHCHTHPPHTLPHIHAPHIHAPHPCIMHTHGVQRIRENSNVTVTYKSAYLTTPTQYTSSNRPFPLRRTPDVTSLINVLHKLG